MQAFYFKSGIGDAPCEEAPDSGILIQTPEGAGQINMTVNEVDIQLGSTAYLQAQAGGEMAVNVVEHQVTVTADGTTRIVPAGSRVRVPLDANLAANGPPSEPEPYNNADLAALPVSHMPRAVTIAPALTQAELDALALNVVPTTGTWRFSVTSGEWGEGCPGDSGYALGTGQWVLDGTSSFYGFEASEFTNPEPGFFVADRANGAAEPAHLELRILSPTMLEGKHVSYVGGLVCATIEFTMEAVSDE
jgi:hypothetical protein